LIFDTVKAVISIAITRSHPIHERLLLACLPKILLKKAADQALLAKDRVQLCLALEKKRADITGEVIRHNHSQGEKGRGRV
jgi:hypothetical protein